MSLNINNNLSNQPRVSNKSITNNVSMIINGKEVFISKTRVKKIARGFAKFAYLNGETNDEEKYSEDLEADLSEALNLLKKERNKKAKN